MNIHKRYKKSMKVMKVHKRYKKSMKVMKVHEDLKALTKFHKETRRFIEVYYPSQRSMKVPKGSYGFTKGYATFICYIYLFTGIGQIWLQYQDQFLFRYALWFSIKIKYISFMLYVQLHVSKNQNIYTYTSLIILQIKWQFHFIL